MAKIIVTSRYFKNPSRSNIGKLLRYMGTREGVEKVSVGVDHTPATVRQKRLIQKLLKAEPAPKIIWSIATICKSRAGATPRHSSTLSRSETPTAPRTSPDWFHI